VATRHIHNDAQEITKRL